MRRRLTRSWSRLKVLWLENRYVSNISFLTMWRKQMKLFLMAAGLVASFSALAGQGVGRVTFIGASHDTNVPWVFFNIENYSNHACATPNNSLGKLMFTTDSTRGREMLSILLSAEARQTAVTVVGTGSCVEQNREAVNFLYLGDPTK